MHIPSSSEEAERAQVYGSIAEEGLGMTSWWEPAPEDMEE